MGPSVPSCLERVLLCLSAVHRVISYGVASTPGPETPVTEINREWLVYLAECREDIGNDAGDEDYRVRDERRLDERYSVSPAHLGSPSVRPRVSAVVIFDQKCQSINQSSCAMWSSFIRLVKLRNRNLFLTVF